MQGEECDAGNDIDIDECLSLRVFASYGDGTRHPLLGEDCDDANDMDDDESANACTGDIAGFGSCADFDLDSATGRSLRTGTKVGAGNDLEASCASSARAEDLTFNCFAPKSGSYAINTEGSGYGPSLHIRGFPEVIVVDECASSFELACNDDSVIGLKSQIISNAEAGVEYLIIVNGFGTSTGDDALNIVAPERFRLGPNVPPHYRDTMRMVPLLLFVLLLPAVSAAEMRTVQQEVVYGSDDREIAEEHPDAVLRAIAERSLVAVVENDRIGDDSLSFETTPLGERQELCEGERFAELPTLARCTGVLISEDLVLTAGHCMENVGACRSRSLVFDWRVRDGEVVPASPSAVYGCVQVVVADRRGYGNLTLDYSVVRLDRPVDATREPVSVRTEPVQAGESVALVSHPSGLPAIIDTGGVVVDERAGERDYFVVDTDSFEGSSGGPIFDASGALIGVLVRGEEDYVEEGGCQVVNVVAEPAEEVTRVEWALRALCASTPRLPLCADRDACGVECTEDCAEDCEPLPPAEWTCVDEVYGAGDGCDCECGLLDPDCDQRESAVYGCGSGYACDRDGFCTDEREVPESWSCNSAAYADGTCDCACGAIDPDCAAGAIAVGCLDGEVCREGTCAASPVSKGRCSSGAGGGILLGLFGLAPLGRNRRR